MDPLTIVSLIVKGALAGGLSGWATDHVTMFMWKRESPASRRRYEEVTGGVYAPERLAIQAQKITRKRLSEKGQKKLAFAIHWGIGVGMGVVYVFLRRYVPGADFAQGLLFGFAFWLLLDEGLNPLIGGALRPTAYPWQAHVRGLVGHLAYGLVADTALDLVDLVV